MDRTAVHPYHQNDNRRATNTHLSFLPESRSTDERANSQDLDQTAYPLVRQNVRRDHRLHHPQRVGPCVTDTRHVIEAQEGFVVHDARPFFLQSPWPVLDQHEGRLLQGTDERNNAIRLSTYTPSRRSSPVQPSRRLPSGDWIHSHIEKIGHERESFTSVCQPTLNRRHSVHEDK